MTFELSPDHLALRDRARAFAATARDRAADIDRNGVVPPDLLGAGRGLGTADPLPLTVVAEELATASAALAMSVAAPDAAQPPLDLNGLRGAPTLPPDNRSQLLLAAVAVGIGRGAMDAALAELRRSTATPGADVEKPHWVVADAATELDAARLLVYKAARSMTDSDVAVARLMASAAADHAVAAALRVSGADALKAGSVLERLSRDVRAVALILGTEEHQRATAADAMFPR
jgi:alkylation response protein AidB-like acyl-CoA dehydrogenase